MSTTEELLRDWYRRLRFAQFVHYEAAKMFERLNYWLGIPIVVLSTFVGTSVFANIGKLIDTRVQISIGLISVSAATLASLQTFLKFSERAERHRIAASKYGALRREVEEILATADDLTQETITPLRQKIDRLAEEAPHVPDKIWAKRKNVLKEDRDNLVGLPRDK
ncbi:MAG: SLATT domain-containing protein [Elainellaceae cyanobacterium]